jgi:CRISP-associated protein Cas1
VTWRSVVISKPARLRRENFSLVVEQEQSARVPFEDIAVIVLNHREINLNHAVLSACGEHGIGLFSTGDNHQPNGVFLPFLQHSRATRMQRLQMDIDRPLAKRTWAAIVRTKIKNQAACLQLAGRNSSERLQAMAERVRSGDTDNMEARASAHYFPELFDVNFFRAQERWSNAALNYGYAVLRGAIARGLVAHGFLPNLGLFHRSEQNAFNLADDVIEPFRPVVDLHVAQQFKSGDVDQELLPADKVALVGLLNVDVAMPRGTMSVLSAIEHCIESLARIYEGANETVLELPTLIGLQQHVVEG